MRIELTTSSLPRKCSTPELQRLLSCLPVIKQRTVFLQEFTNSSKSGRRGSNSRPIAWKAIALPIELLPLILKKISRNFLTVLQRSNHCSNKQNNECGQSRVRTCVLVREQIYSLSPLTARPSALIASHEVNENTNA